MIDEHFEVALVTIVGGPTEDDWGPITAAVMFFEVYPPRSSTACCCRPSFLRSPRRKILEYTTDKLAGVYGGSPTQRRRFYARLSIEQARRGMPELGGLSRVSL